MEQARFQLTNYSFNHAIFNFTDIPQSTEWEVKFSPKGSFYAATSVFDLGLLVQIRIKGQKEDNIAVLCDAQFTFNAPLTFEDIPSYFYTNSIPIIYPYIKAFIGTMGVLANVKSMLILPTYNLSPLAEVLRKNTKEEK